MPNIRMSMFHVNPDEIHKVRTERFEADEIIRCLMVFYNEHPGQNVKELLEKILDR